MGGNFSYSKKLWSSFGDELLAAAGDHARAPFTDGIAYGTIDRTSVHATTFGTALQATDYDKFFGHANYFTFGGSVDRSLLSFSATSQLGAILPDFTIVNGGFPNSGDIISTAGQIGYVPIFLTGNTTY